MGCPLPLPQIHMYEPIHGSAPDIAGKSVVNPVAMVCGVHA